MPLSLILFALLLPAPSRADVKEALKNADTVSKCVRQDPTAGHVFLAHCKETIVRAGMSSEMSYNQMGHRDRDYSMPPRPGTIRVLFLGSSQMAGPGVQQPDTAPKALEKLLRKRYKKVEVINGGVEGYSSIQVAAMVPTWLEYYKPTHVILFLDVGQSVNADPASSVYAEWGEDTVVVTPRIFPFFKRLAGWLKMDLNVWANQRKLLTAQLFGYRARTTISCILRFGPGMDRIRCLLSPTLRAFMMIDRQVPKGGAKFQFFVSAQAFDNNTRISPGHDRDVALIFDRLTPLVEFQGSQLKQAVFETGLAVRFFEPRFRQEHFLPGDYHLSASGSRYFAELLEPHVKTFLDQR